MTRWGSRETLNKYSMDENRSGNPMLFAGEGARATLVQSFPNSLDFQLSEQKFQLNTNPRVDYPL
jgi:hypothetical protein